MALPGNLQKLFCIMVKETLLKYVVSKVFGKAQPSEVLSIFSSHGSNSFMETQYVSASSTTLGALLCQILHTAIIRNCPCLKNVRACLHGFLSNSRTAADNIGPRHARLFRHTGDQLLGRAQGLAHPQVHTSELCSGFLSPEGLGGKLEEALSSTLGEVVGRLRIRREALWK